MMTDKKDGKEPIRDKGSKNALVQANDLHEVVFMEGLSTPSVFCDYSFSWLTVLCAEPGMGKSYLASMLMRRAAAKEVVCYHYAYDDVDSETACERIVRCCRETAKKGCEARGPLVVFDGITPGDECDTYREARAIERLVNAGARVLICLRPEARQLAEQLNGATVLGCDELLYRSYQEDGEALSLTGGIPVLVNAANLDLVRGIGRIAEGSCYQRALKQLLVATLRCGLSDEEFRVRLAMILLGSGSIEEVHDVSGRCDVEQLHWLEHDVPLLGADARGKRFSCYAVGSDEVFERCISALQIPCAGEPSLVVRCCAALAARGDARRSSIVSQLCASEHDFIYVCATWGVPYAEIGKTKIVREALRLAARYGMSLGGRGLLSAAAVSALVGTSKELDGDMMSLEGLRVDSSTDSRLHRKVMLLGASRDVWRNPNTALPLLSADVEDTVGLACIEHVKAVRLLASGRFNEAYALLAEQLPNLAPKSVPEALLCDDGALSLALSGGAPDMRETCALRATNDFFARQESVRLASYHQALRDAAEVLMSSEVSTGSIEEAAAHAERAGDTFMRAFLLGVCAVADMRAHALSRAHVRASRAAQEARALGVSYLSSAAELVDALCLSMLGENDALAHFCEVREHPSSLALMGRACAKAVGCLAPPDYGIAIPLGIPCPSDLLWLLNLISDSCDTIWGSLTNIIPRTWIQALDSAKRRRMTTRVVENIDRSEGVRHELSVLKGGTNAGGVLPSGLELGSQTELLPVDGSHGRIRVSVLGRFNVECDGVDLPKHALDRRRACDLVALLAIVPGHKMRRYQAIDVLWPADDYFRGPRRLYEATGEARARLGERCQGAKVIVSDRKQGIVGFDGSMVTCDVDDFEREVRKVLSEDGDDFWVLEHARAMEQIYANGPDEHLTAMGRLVQERAEELRSMYVDACVAAGEAALRVGKTKLAVRYGFDAYQQGTFREDAMLLLARALRAAGRGHEVLDYYSRFAQRMFAERGMPPSLALQQVVGAPPVLSQRQRSA